MAYQRSRLPSVRRARLKFRSQASNNGKPWPAEHDGMVLDPNLSAADVALATGRTKDAVLQRRSLKWRELGLQRPIRMHAAATRKHFAAPPPEREAHASR